MNTQPFTQTWTVWVNGWVFTYELSGCEFESSCSHLIVFSPDKQNENNFVKICQIEEAFSWHIKCREMNYLSGNKIFLCQNLNDNRVSFLKGLMLWQSHFLFYLILWLSFPCFKKASKQKNSAHVCFFHLLTTLLRKVSNIQYGVFSGNSQRIFDKLFSHNAPS